MLCHTIELKKQYYSLVSSTIGTALKRNEANTITPKSRNKFTLVVSSALRDDVISRFLAEVDKEVCSVKKHNTKIESTKMGSRKKVAGIFTRVLDRYQQAFQWLNHTSSAIIRIVRRTKHWQKFYQQRKKIGWYWQKH
jgi:hypothetical protein